MELHHQTSAKRKVIYGQTLSGFDVLKQVKTSEALRSIPVIILSTSGSEKDMARAYACYANGYLVKPLDFAAFAQLAEAFGLYWLEWNQTPSVPGP